MDEKKSRGRGFFWQSLIVSLVVVCIAGLAVTFLMAACRGSQVVDKDYYSRGLHYGSDREGERNGARQGWRLESGVEKGGMVVKVHDGQGTPVSGGRVTLDLAEWPGRGGGRAWADGAPLAGKEEGPGVYALALPAGKTDLRGSVTFVRGDASVTERVVILR